MIESEEANHPALSDLQLLTLAAAVWAAALITVPVPFLPAALSTAGTLIVRRPLLFALSLTVLAAGLGHRAVEAFQPRAPAFFSGDIVVVAEARRLGFGWRAMVRLPDGDRVEASGFGRSGIELGRAGGGTTLTVSGRLSPMADTPWARSRHLVGRLAITEVVAQREPSGPRAVVEQVRGAIVAGADPLDPDRRPLYLGLVVGEDGEQSPAQRARFRAAGLSHLLAVSGQNVAFVLAVAGPLVRLLGLRGRLLATIGILVVFAVATRFEPSVLRATVTAGLATATSLSGYERDGIRLLGLAVIALVLIDPFLVHSVGFQLSVAASAGILVLTPALAARLAGPTVLVQAVSVTVGAQLAVLPLQLHYFGSVSAASIPANVLAGWAAGLVMAWGLSIGVVAGMTPPAIGELMQQPVGWLLAWLDGVAGLAVRVPAPTVSVPVAIAVVALVVLRWLADRPSSRPTVLWRLGVMSTAVGMVVVGIAAVPEPPTDPLALVGGGHWFPGDGDLPSVLVVAADADTRLVDDLARHGLLHIDLVIAEAGSGRGALVAGAVSDLVNHRVVLAPSHHRIVGAHRVTSRLVVETTAGTLVLEPDDNRLRVTLEPGMKPP